MPQHKSPKVLKGFSLIELLMAMLIIPAMILIVGQVYNTQLKTFLNQSALIQANTSNKIALEAITNDIRESTGVTNCTYYSTNNIFCGYPTPCIACPLPNIWSSPTGGVIVLSYWPIDPSTKIPYNPTNEKYDMIIYQLTGKIIYRHVVPNQSYQSANPTTVNLTTRTFIKNKIIANNVSSLNFNFNTSTPYSNSTRVTITLTTESKSGEKTFTSTNTSDVYLRNKP